MKIEHVYSATIHMLRDRAHHIDPQRGPVWVLTVQERDAILHGAKVNNHLGTKIKRLKARETQHSGD